MSNDSQRNSAFNTAANSKVYHAQLEDIAQFTPEKINHLRRGGIRSGTGYRRTDAETLQMLDKVPPSQRAGVDGQSAAHKVKEYLSDKDASHIKSHKHGGSSNPDNIKWENNSINRARGSRNMTPHEQVKLDLTAQLENLTGAIKAGCQAAPKGAAIGAITTAPFSMLRNGLRVVRGEISAQDAAKETGKETLIGGGVGGGTAFIVTTVATAYPPIAIALTAISPALWVAGGVGLTYEFFKILDDHKKEVRAYYESMTEQELQYLSQVEADLIYEHEKSMSVLDEEQQLTDVIVNRPRESGVQAAMQRYMESRQIYQSLQNLPHQSLKASKQNLLPPS
ncbi:MAG: hypothetical protein KME09_18890 [Pleurocapsa minor HA4230-MV1]|jgi:hypothetical protein|nr:hypothetical protein [Pleurocapsa minor HA4230-MV1]